MPSYSAALTGGSSPNSHRIEFHIQLISQNVAANTSRIARGLYIVHTGGSPGSWSGSDTYPYATNIGGVQVNGNAGYDFRSNLFGSILIAYDVRDYTHNADGTLSLSFSASYSSGHIGSGSMSGTYSPPTIPRASVSSFSAGLSFDVGTAVTINTNRASSSFTHTLQLWEHGVGAQTPIETIGTGVGASKSWTPDLALAEYFPNAVERTFFLRTITFNGATQIGVRDLVFTLRAPTGMVPTVSGILVEDQNPTVVSTVGKPVQSLSPLKVTVSGAGIHGSTVESAVATIMGTTVQSGDVVLATQAGSVSVTATVTDSRGRQGVGNTSVDVLAYAPPAVTVYQVRRCDSVGTPQDNGEHLRVDITASIQSLINSTQRNAMTIRAFTKPLTGTTWTNRNVIASPALTWEGGRGTITTHFVMQGGAVFAGTESWDVRVEVHDKFQKHDALTTVATDAVVMDFGPDGVGVGKMHEQGALDVAGDVYAGGKLLLPAASNAETQTGTATDLAVTPASLTARTATTSRRGVAELATAGEYLNADSSRIATPALIHAHPITLRGTAAQRAAYPSKFWQFWMDTDGDEYLWVGDRAGGWRRYSGLASAPAAGWEYSTSSGSVITVGRSPSVTLPTALEPDEHVAVTAVSVGSGFGVISGSAITRNPSNTVVQLRFIQIGAVTQQGLTVAWQIIKA